MPKPTSGPSTGVIILQQIQPHEWIFDLPRVTSQALDELHDGIDLLEAGRIAAAKTSFNRLVKKLPEFLDAHHHLALSWYREGDHDKAGELWARGAEFALKMLPAHFSMEKDHLPWMCLENRPFLRLYNGHALSLMRMRQTREALQVFRNMLNLNPHDNQGVRSLAITCHFELQEPEGALEICDRFPEDIASETLYGRPLALFQLERKDAAAKSMKMAINQFPLIAAELLKAKHRRPPDLREDRITFGGKDQAYHYWMESGKFWTETPGALEFLMEHLTNR